MTIQPLIHESERALGQAQDDSFVLPKNMFRPQTTESTQVIKEFAAAFQGCLANRDHEGFAKLVDRNSSGIDTSVLLGVEVEARFKRPEEVSDFGAEILSQTDDNLSIFFYTEFEGDYRPAIVEFDLIAREEEYEIDFRVIKPS